MIEPEIAFCDLIQNMDNAEGFVKFVVGRALERCADDLQFFNDFYVSFPPTIQLAWSEINIKDKWCCKI